MDPFFFHSFHLWHKQQQPIRCPGFPVIGGLSPPPQVTLMISSYDMPSAWFVSKATSKCLWPDLLALLTNWPSALWCGFAHNPSASWHTIRTCWRLCPWTPAVVHSLICISLNSFSTYLHLNLFTSQLIHFLTYSPLNLFTSHLIYLSTYSLLNLFTS